MSAPLLTRHSLHVFDTGDYLIFSPILNSSAAVPSVLPVTVCPDSLKRSEVSDFYEAQPSRVSHIVTFCLVGAGGKRPN